MTLHITDMVDGYVFYLVSFSRVFDIVLGFLQKSFSFFQFFFCQFLFLVDLINQSLISGRKLKEIESRHKVWGKGIKKNPRGKFCRVSASACVRVLVRARACAQA